MWGKKSVAELKQFVVEEFTKDGFLRLDYFEIVDAATLTDIENNPPPSPPPHVGEAGRGITACIAAYDGQIRLIDNIILTD